MWCIGDATSEGIFHVLEAIEWSDPSLDIFGAEINFEEVDGELDLVFFLNSWI